MKRSTGVTVIAALSLLGSVVTLLLGIFMAWVMFGGPVTTSSQFRDSPTFFKVTLFLSVLMYVLPAIWGIWTSVGLFQLKNWARLSVIVFSVLLILMSGCGGLFSLVIPIPATVGQPVDPKVMAAVRIFMGTFAAGLVSVGVWWVVFFNRPKVKQQFVTALPTPMQITEGFYTPAATVPSAPRLDQRPLSFTILAWFLLVSCLFIPLNLGLRFPAAFLTRVLSGWSAAAFYLAVGALCLYIGIGLLRLKTAARAVAVWYLVFALVNSAVFFLAPGGRARMHSLLAAQQAMFPWIPQPESSPFSFDPIPFMILGMVSGLVSILVPLYFLITRKGAYERAIVASKLGSSPAPIAANPGGTI